MKRACMALVLGWLLACALSFALAENPLWDETENREVELLPLTATLDAQGGEAEVRAVRIDGENWLFLPAFASLEDFRLSWEGQSVAWEAGETEDGVLAVQATLADGTTLSLGVMRSEHLRALFLFSDDPQNAGRAYIEDCNRHENRATGSMALVSPDGTIDCADHLRQIRGRGNYTWRLQKKSYQIKLENKTDLLRTGDPAERSRTWVLLADQSDGTLLRNRIALDLALEWGMENSAHCESVDLYYDGEYRGLYLLSEKVETGEGRLGVDDYEEMVEVWNRQAGQTDLASLPTAVCQNRFGSDFSYVQGLAEAADPGVGDFLVEMENRDATLSDRCWFTLEDGSVLGLKNPENASEAMVHYISERLTEARQTLQNGGVHPQTGRTLQEDFDVEAFARILLLNELASNPDGYSYSSSWFVLPAGESRFEPGTPWDFDIAWRFKSDGSNAGGAGTKDQSGWVADFYRCPEMVEAMARLYEQELLPLVTKILLGGGSGRYLQSLDAYFAEIDASARMNFTLWEVTPFRGYRYGLTMTEERTMLRSFLTQRSEWLKMALADARPDAEQVTLWGRAGYLFVEEDVELFTCPWNHASVRSCEWEQVSEAEEGAYAQWRLEAVIEPDEGYSFDDPRITLGGETLRYERLEDGALRVSFLFDDLSYLPADYYGEDIGLVYNEAAYRENYPELSEAYGDDSEGLMDYFCGEGMYEGQMGNGFFLPSEIVFCHPELENELGTDWQMYYSEFMAYGYELEWTRLTGRGFGLSVSEAGEDGE